MNPEIAAEKIAALVSEVPVDERRLLFDILSRCPYFRDFGQIAIHRSPEQEAPITPIESRLTAESLLSAEQLDYANNVRLAMSETFNIEMDNIWLVPLRTPELGWHVVAINASPNGQYIGSNNDIQLQRKSNPIFYKINVNDKWIDTLASTSSAVYRAMILEARARGVNPLPDSLELSKQTGTPWTWTMLTSKTVAASGHIKHRHVSGINVRRGGFLPSYNSKANLVRPAVVIASGLSKPNQ